MDRALARRRMALIAFFFLPGVSLASWVARTPAIRDGIGASIGEMGLVLFGLSVGSMTGILASGPLVGRLGARRIAGAGLSLVVAAMATIGLGAHAGSPWIVALGLSFFGLGMGMAEIALNIDGADIERLARKPLLHSLHGFFSLGSVAGAGLGLLAASLDIPVAAHLAAVAAADALAVAIFIGSVAPDVGRSTGRVGGEPASGPRGLWKDRRLLAIGAIVLAMALAEGAANDWLPILMVDEYGFSQSAGSLTFMAFSAAMAAGRFGGGAILARFGRATALRGGAILGGAGLALAIFSDRAIFGGAAVILWGLGAALGFPVALSAAGDSGPDPAARVKLVATAGYIAFLVGPPALGFVGERFGLRAALLVVLAAMVLAAFLTRSIPESASSPSRSA